jgi:pimeloyl-ACP methyl ester carboxylesterase
MEEPVTFESGGDVLRGVRHRPDSGGGSAAVVFLHGWSGCRLGPHRMFVTAARRLEALGIASLRFDFRGRGDSGGVTAETSIASMIEDATAAVAFMQSEATAIILLGICSGGKVAVGTASRGMDTVGLILLSAEAMGEMHGTYDGTRKSLVALREYAVKLTRPETWRRLATGKVNTGMVRKALTEHEMPSAEELVDESNILRAFRSYTGSILSIYGAAHPETVHAAGAYRNFFDAHGIDHEMHAVDGANHSFYGLDWEQQVLTRIEAWLRRR